MHTNKMVPGGKHYILNRFMRKGEKKTPRKTKSKRVWDIRGGENHETTPASSSRLRWNPSRTSCQDACARTIPLYGGRMFENTDWWEAGLNAAEREGVVEYSAC